MGQGNSKQSKRKNHVWHMQIHGQVELPDLMHTTQNKDYPELLGNLLFLRSLFGFHRESVTEDIRKGAHHTSPL